MLNLQKIINGLYRAIANNLYLLMKLNFSNINLKYGLFTIYIIVFIIVVMRPYELTPDSGGYLNIDIYRSAVYPLFLSIIRFFSGHYFYTLTIIVQVLLGVFSVHFFIKNLKKNIQLNSIFYILLAIILLAPYVYLHRVANNIMSEALSYPLYLIVTSFFISSFINEDKKYLLRGLPILFILLLTRSQFLFLIPVGILILVWIIIKKNNLKEHYIVLPAFILMPLFVSITDKTYHKIMHDHFVSTPWTGIHLITPAFYVSNTNDFSIYNTNEEKEFFKTIHSALTDQKLNIHELDSTENATLFYIANYSNIANETVFEVGRTLSLEKSDINTQYIFVDTITNQMALPLVIKNFKSWFKIYIGNAVNAFDTKKNLLLYLFIYAFSIFILFKSNTKASKVIVLILSLMFLNVFLISIGMHTLKRFTFCNDWVIFLVVFILLDSFNKTLKFNYEH